MANISSLLCFLLSYQLGLMVCAATDIAVGVHEQLGIGVDRNEGLEVAVALDQVHHVLHLDLRVSRGAVVGLGAGVATGTGAWTYHREIIIEQPLTNDRHISEAFCNISLECKRA